jgi:hypothetical protein
MRRRGPASRRQLLWFLNTSLKSTPQYAQLLPGTTHIAGWPGVKGNTGGPGLVNAEGRCLGTGKRRKLMSTTVEQAMAQGILFAGNPTASSPRSSSFTTAVADWSLTMISRTGFMTHANREEHPALWQVLPRLKSQSSARGAGAGALNTASAAFRRSSPAPALAFGERIKKLGA